MENRMIKTENLRLARVKYFDVEHNGAELTEHEVYAFLESIGGKYVNVFHPTEELPVYDRAPYANVTRDGEDYGNRLFHLSGDVANGPCYVLDLVSVSKMLGKEDISLSALKEYVLSSKNFFLDRISLIQQEKGVRKVRMLPQLMEDTRRMNAFQEYLDGHSKTRKYVK